MSPVGPDTVLQATIVYGNASSYAAVFELRARMLVQATAKDVPAFQAVTSTRTKLDAVVEAIVAWTTTIGKGTDEERRLLKTCVTLRNKLLHCDLGRADFYVRELGAKHGTGSVTMLRWDGAVPPPDLFDQQGTPVASVTTKESGIFGWLLEAAGSGLFVEAAKAFERASAVLARVLGEWTEDLIAEDEKRRGAEEGA